MHTRSFLTYITLAVLSAIAFIFYFTPYSTGAVGLAVGVFWLVTGIYVKEGLTGVYRAKTELQDRSIAAVKSWSRFEDAALLTYLSYVMFNYLFTDSM